MRAVALVTALSLASAPFASAQTTPRPIDNVGNNPTDVYAGTPNQQLLRLDVSSTYFANASGALFPGSLPPATVATNTTTYPAFQCLVAPPAPPTQPYPRCVSDLVNGYTNSPLGLQVADAGVRSVRKVSHLESFWAQWLSYDLLDIGVNPAEQVNIGLPTDDVAINTGSSGVSAAVIINSNNSLEFYRALYIVDPATQQPNHTGINSATGFLDASPIYGSTDAVLRTLRDDQETHGKMKLLAQNLTSGGELGPLPPLGPDGRFLLGNNPARSANIYSDALTIILLREHNRQCDRLYQLYTTTWNDTQYFQEARKWVIAFVQKITTTEYLGVLLGRPLPPYTGYRQDVKPGIEAFFAMASFRYGHSVLSDEYRMVDTDAQLIESFSLKGMLNSASLIRNKYDIATILRSVSLQVQEEVDVYYADMMRNYASVLNTTFDTASSDHLRSRDQGLPLYNDARQAFGLPRKNSFADITKDTKVQKRLAQTYQSVDQVESLVGGLAEDHVAGANVGELFNASLWKQFMRLRDSDRFWYENPGMFTAAELDVIQHTSLRDIIIRNLADPATGNLQTVPATQTYTASLNDTSQPNPLSSLLPDNLWFVQPIGSQSRKTVGNAPSNSLVDPNAYPNYYQFTSQYMIQWNTDLSAKRVNIALTLQSSQGWFGIGLNPSGALSMAGADFIIASASPTNGVKLNLYRSQGNAQAPVNDTGAYVLSNVNATIVEGVAVLVTFTRAMDTGVAGKAVFSNSEMNLIWAYNPQESNPTYHGGNRGGIQINFLSGMIAEVNAGSKRTTQLVHGVFMFGVWALLFPVSIYIMRFAKHWEMYLTIHRVLQLIGGVSVGAVGAAAITAIDPSVRTVHSTVGLILYCLIFVQIGMGLISNYSMEWVESVNTGIILVIKKTHKYFGATLLIGSLANIYLGIITFDPTTIMADVYLGWLGILVAVFVIKQVSFSWQAMRNRKKGLEAKAGEDRLGMREFINDEVIEKLTLITWKDFNERVASGAVLVMVDDFVFDIMGWVGSHPGGSMILKRANGTDISNDLLGLRRDTDGMSTKKQPLRRQGSGLGPQDRISSRLEKYLAPTDKERLKRASTQVSGVTSKRGGEDFFTRMLPGGSVASTMDYINSNFFQPGEMARHAHSNYAKRKLASMVTARIDNSDDGNAMGLPSPDMVGRHNGPGSTPGSPTGTVVSPSPAPGAVFPKPIMPFLLRAPATRHQFRRYVLIDKVNIALGKQPVVAFTFSPVHTIRNDLDLPLLPGQYVELMSQVRQEVVKRPYNVVHGSVRTEFTIYVKIYTNGKMSSHLNLERQVKTEISVRGPFDMTNRVEAADIIWRRPKGVDPNLAPRQDSIMLNPKRADGRWQHVYAIVGGTGITPILQLIQYYQYVLEEEHKRHVKLAYSAPDSPQDPPIVTWINILFANHTVLDVFESGQLESLATNTGNPHLRITISYVFSEPPDNWQGLSGLLDREKVEDWVRSCQEQSTTEHQNSAPEPPVHGRRLSDEQLKTRGAIHKSHTIREITQRPSLAVWSPPGTGQHHLHPRQQRQQSGAQGLEVPTISVTFADEEVGSNNSGHPDNVEDISMLPLSRSPTAVGIDEITGILEDEIRQNVVFICGPDKMMESVKTILTQIEIEEIKENSWVLTLF